MPKPLDDLTGQRFGRLTVQHLDGMSPDGRRRLWRCTCDCGGSAAIATAFLKNGRTQSCGCIGRELASRLGSSRATHRDTGSKTYKAWLSMRSRCESDPAYVGISVCERWAASYRNFLADMGPAPAGLSLERRDSTKGYAPDNCIWGTDLQQQNNKTSNIWLLPDGTRVDYSRRREAKTLAQIVAGTEHSYQTVYSRLQRGWSLADALSTPARQRKPETQPRKK